MAEIKEWNKCENCVHSNVCEFRTSREECVGEMNGKLDNLGYMRDFLYSLLNVKNLSKESLLEKMHLKGDSTLHNRGGAVDESLDQSRLPLDFSKNYDILDKILQRYIYYFYILL